MEDQVMMEGKWEFNESVTACFPDMLSRSIPGYDNMRDLCHKIGQEFIVEETGRCKIIDVGCSTGLGVDPFISQYGGMGQYTLIDNSSAMIQACKKKYADLIQAGKMDVRCGKVQEVYPRWYGGVDLVLSILTLQFIPIEHRQSVLDEIYFSLRTDGALIIAEKVLGDTHTGNDLLVRKYYTEKFSNGYSKTQIENKRKALEGVLVPVKAAWNEDMLRAAGFRHVERFWQSLNFAAWVAIK